MVACFSVWAGEADDAKGETVGDAVSAEAFRFSPQPAVLKAAAMAVHSRMAFI
ncbi:hypothetical protein D3C86_2106110 [compost metagenome]